MIIDFAKNLFRKKKPQAQNCLQQMVFKRNDKTLSIGIESELQIVSKDTLALSNIVDELSAALNMPKNVDREAMMSTIEIISGIHDSAHEAVDEIGNVFAKLMVEADKLNAAILPCSYHPTAHHTEVKTRSDERYQQFAERFQWLYRQWVANGMHVHIGMRDEKECMRYMNFFRYFVPHFTALSASSPFFQGDNTGILSSRAIINQALPIAPLVHSVTSWEDLRQLVVSLENSGTIKNYKDLWWDIRPAPRYGTLELRMFDMPTNIREQKAIVAFVHTLAHWFESHGEWLTEVTPPKHWIARENKWRAIRYGMDAELIKDTDGEIVSLRTEMETWIERVRPVALKLGYQREMADLQEMIESGPAARRMQQVFENTSDMSAVIRHVMAEFASGKPSQIVAKEPSPPPTEQVFRLAVAW